MPDQTPIKYDAGQHRPFAPGDTLPPSVLGLRQRVRPGLGIAIVDNGDGTLTIVNTCCDTQPPNGSVHTLTMSPVLANITEGESACWAVVLNAPVEFEFNARLEAQGLEFLQQRKAPYA